MASNDYHFNTQWQVPGTVEEVYKILSDPLDLPRWWPSVYLDVQLLNPEAEAVEDRIFSLHSRGWLPYTLLWQFQVVDPQPPHFLGLRAQGDFVGQGLWTLLQEGDMVTITYDWQVRAEKPLLKRFSLLLKPIFSANHRWAMRQGEKSLALELARRQASTKEARASLPTPPGPSSAVSLKLLGAAAVTALAFGLLGRRFRKAGQEPRK